MTCFQLHPESDLASDYTKPLYKTKYSETLVKYEDGFDMNTGKLIIHSMATSHSTTDKNSYVPVKFQKNSGKICEKLKPQDTDSTRLQNYHLNYKTVKMSLKLSQNYKTVKMSLDAIHYDIHLDMKIDYTKRRIFQEMSFTELKHSINYMNLNARRFYNHLH